MPHMFNSYVTHIEFILNSYSINIYSHEHCSACRTYPIPSQYPEHHHHHLPSISGMAATWLSHSSTLSIRYHQLSSVHTLKCPKHHYLLKNFRHAATWVTHSATLSSRYHQLSSLHTLKCPAPLPAKKSQAWQPLGSQSSTSAWCWTSSQACHPSPLAAP